MSADIFEWRRVAQKQDLRNRQIPADVQERPVREEYEDTYWDSWDLSNEEYQNATEEWWRGRPL